MYVSLARTEVAPLGRTPTLRGPTPHGKESVCHRRTRRSSGARAIELARERAEPIAEIAADIGISESCLRTWLHQADVDEGRREGLSMEERVELVRLRRENRVLRMEKEILGKAAGLLRRREHLPLEVTYHLVEMEKANYRRSPYLPYQWYHGSTLDHREEIV